MIAPGAAAVELISPLPCPANATCYIQSLVDRDPGPDAKDFACGTLTYDGHKGVDFRVATLSRMRAGVDIVAAAPGQVRAVRDGLPDSGLAGVVKGKECGNGVVLDHGEGWTTQYCHLAKGAVAVNTGDAVAAGQIIGRIGLSGKTEFPHVHFVLRKDGAVIDPFDGAAMGETCDAPAPGGHWRDPPPLQMGGVVDLGFTDRPPTLAGVREGLPKRSFDRDGDAFILWARGFGLRKGDRLNVALLGPNGEVMAEAARDIDRPRAVEFVYVGKRRRGAWPAGRYRGLVSVDRGGAPLDAREIELTLD